VREGRPDGRWARASGLPHHPNSTAAGPVGRLVRVQGQRPDDFCQREPTGFPRTQLRRRHGAPRPTRAICAMRSRRTEHGACLGRGIYESEDFYDLCDELGLLVWQTYVRLRDLPRADDALLRRRAGRRTAQTVAPQGGTEHASHLWAATTRIEQANPELLKQPRLSRDYDAAFPPAVPAVVARNDGGTDYGTSSAHRRTGTTATRGRRTCRRHAFLGRLATAAHECVW